MGERPWEEAEDAVDDAIYRVIKAKTNAAMDEALLNAYLKALELADVFEAMRDALPEGKAA